MVQDWFWRKQEEKNAQEVVKRRERTKSEQGGRQVQGSNAAGKLTAQLHQMIWNIISIRNWFDQTQHLWR